MFNYKYFVINLSLLLNLYRQIDRKNFKTGVSFLCFVTLLYNKFKTINGGNEICQM